MTRKPYLFIFTLGLSALPLTQALGEDPAPIPIVKLEREEPVDFAKEIYPLLKKNCVACHNSSTAKANLNLESPKTIIQGGNDGPAVVPGQPEISFLLLVASHQEDPIMPPEDNKSNAVPFTSEELGLLQQWIAEGAKGEALIASPTPENWILASRNDYPVYHLALGPEDRFVAASRGQRVFLYDIIQGRGLGQLVDPELAGEKLYEAHPPTHRDFVQSIAFSPDGWIATGGFRNVKLWHPIARDGTVVHSLPEAITSLAVSSDGLWAAAGDAAGHVLLWKPNDSQHPTRQEKRHEGGVSGLTFSHDGHWLGTSGIDGKVHLIDLATGEINRTYTSEHPWHSVLFVSSPERLLAASATGKITQWLPANAESNALNEITAHDNAIMALAAHPSQPNEIFSAGEDGTVKRWNLAENTMLGSFNHGEALLELTLSPDGERLVTVSGTSAKVWNTQDGAHLRDLAVNPEATTALAQLKRQHTVAQALLENRKQKASDREKAWQEEFEKAKKAASDQLTAKREADDTERAAHQPRLAEVDGKAKLDAANAPAESLKKTVEESENRVKQLGDQLAQEREARGKRLQELSARIEETKTRHQANAETLQRQTEALEKSAALKERTRAALAELREIGALLTEASTAGEAILQTENLLADIQQNIAAMEAGVLQSKEAELALGEELKTWQRQHDEVAGALNALEAESQELTKNLEKTKADLATAEAAAKQLAETHKAAEEEATKADEALAAAKKALDQAVENAEVAFRLSQRASEENTRAQTALTIAETQVQQRQEAVEAAEKSDPPSLTSAAFARGGEHFALGRAQGGLLVFSRDGDRLLDTLPPVPASDVVSLDGGQWLTGTPEKELRSWHGDIEWAWQRTLGAIDDPKILIDRVTAVAFSPNGTLLATGSGAPSRSGELKIWRVADGSLLMEMEDAHSDTIVGLEFSPDGQYVATASTDRFAKVFSLRDGKLVTAFEGHTGHVLDVSWRGDGLVLATAGADNVIKLWDFEEQRQIKTIDGYNQEITSVAFADTEEKLVTSSGDKSVRLGGDRLDGKEFVYDSALSQDGEWIIAATQDSVVRVWQTKDKKLVQEFAAPSPE